MINYIGYFAAIMTTFSFLPQTLKTIKERDTKSISLVMYTMFTLGVFSWFIYGLLNGDLPIIVANLITFIFAITILTLKLKYK